jgi:hypothetical protein
MATVISRLFSDEAKALKTVKSFERSRFPRRDIAVVRKGEGDTVDTLTARMVKAEIAEGTAKAYAAKLLDGGAVFAVKATYKPLMAKTIARDMLDGADTVDMGMVEEENWVRDTPQPMASILDDHPRFLTRPSETSRTKGPVTAKYGMALLSSRKPMRGSVISGGKKMSFWPIPLLRDGLITKPRLRKDGPVTARFSWMPMLSSTKRESSVISGGKLIVEENLGIPSIIRR